jgi:N-acetyl sugar amidotransferase
MNTRMYQQCVRCVMDTTDPDILFDEHGICNHCTEFIERRNEVKLQRKAGAENLPALVKKIKRKSRGRKYDVLLGISGGVDSCYTAYLLKNLGFRVLLVHLDNGWNSEHATTNIRNIARALQFDYDSYVLDWDEFRTIQLAFLKASVVEVETPTDVAILGALHKVAARHNIKYIISGGNLATEGILPKLWHYNAKDSRYFHAICRQYGAGVPAKFPNFDFTKELYYKFIKGIRIIYLLNYFEYDKEEAKLFLQRELKWKDYGGKHHESRFTKFVQSYLLPKKFNLDYRKATYSSLICSGKITREEAIAQLDLPVCDDYDIKKESEYVAKKLGISMEELEIIVDAPGKYYND